jgi:hypothetical protein
MRPWSSWTTQVRGFRSFDNLRTRTLFSCGKLDLMPVSA